VGDGASRSAFRPVELITVGGAGGAALLADGNSARWTGVVLIARYITAAVAFFIAG
jgi:hypothetical protein